MHILDKNNELFAHISYNRNKQIFLTTNNYRYVYRAWVNKEQIRLCSVIVLIINYLKSEGNPPIHHSVVKQRKTVICHVMLLYYFNRLKNNAIFTYLQSLLLVMIYLLRTKYLIVKAFRKMHPAPHGTEAYTVI